MTFRAVNPIDGSPYGEEIPENTKSEVDSLVDAAKLTMVALADQSPDERAKLLRTIASEIETARTSLIESACAETALAEARISGEITVASLSELIEKLHAE